jgi:hypothetical protein
MNTNTIMRNRNLTQGSVLYKIRELQRERWCRNIGTWGSRHALRASSFFTPVVVSTVPRLISHRRQKFCFDVWRRSFTRSTQPQEVTSVRCYCCCCKREREKTIGIQPPIDQSSAKEKKPPGSVISIDLLYVKSQRNQRELRNNRTYHCNYTCRSMRQTETMWIRRRIKRECERARAWSKARR